MRQGYDLGRVVAVDNGSSDATRDYLAALPLGGRILNRQNLGCGVAWNQGVLALQAEMVDGDEQRRAGRPATGWRTWSRPPPLGREGGLPALVEGPLDYDFEAFAADAVSQRMRDVSPARARATCAACACTARCGTKVGVLPGAARRCGASRTRCSSTPWTRPASARHGGLGLAAPFGSITVSAIKQERGLIVHGRAWAHATITACLGKSTLRRKWDKLAALAARALQCARRNWPATA